MLTDRYFDTPDYIEFDIDDAKDKDMPCERCDEKKKADVRVKIVGGFGNGVYLCNDCFNYYSEDLRELYND